ncbi:MAG: TauD/TfdA family dioxygenase [Acetobacterales bacterium]
MALRAEPLHPLFAARLTGIDTRRPAGRAEVRDIVAMMDRFAVCAIGHDRAPSNEEQIAFSLQLGPMGRGGAGRIKGTGIRIPHDEIVDQSNLGPDGEIYAEDDRRLMFKRANRLWHTDMSFRQVRATYSLLSAHELPPEGGNTEFVDMRAVYDALPQSTKDKLEGLTAEHCYWHSRKLGGGPDPTPEERAARPPAHHPMVNVNPRTGRKALYVASHAAGIDGWPEDEARTFLDELIAFATQPDFIYSHEWREGDVVIWDNLATMHRATPFDDTRFKRDMRRTTCREKELT